MERYLTPHVVRDLSRKMVFLGGPRQVGKTTLARSVAGAAYLNWDIPEHREHILRREFPDAPTIIFDEIHKYRSWRNYLKGVYDLSKQRLKILVTGSARLDLYRYGGDSLQGRYHYLRLHPLSVAELKIGDAAGVIRLLELGGFPEPYLSASPIEAKRWSREYRTRLIQEDIVSVEQLHDLGNLELLMLRLPELVGSPLSLNALREDLQVSHKTVASWIAILERMYSIFRLSPIGAPKMRAIKKAQKHYHFDWTLVPDLPKRFENLVAAHLLKWVHYEQDTLGQDIDLGYFRDVQGNEVDFVVTAQRKPVMLVECKWSDDSVNSTLRALKKRFPAAQAWQIHADGKKDYQTPEGIRVAPAHVFLSTLI